MNNGRSMVLWFAVSTLLVSVLPQANIAVELTGPMDAPSRGGPVIFTNVSAVVGLSGIGGNFFSWGDFDNDHHQDLLIDGKRLFWNSGPPEFTFSDVTLKAGIDRPVNSGVFGDYDNDGWLDIFCGGGSASSDHPIHPDILWHNNRDGTFTDVTELVGGISDTFPTVAGCWADIDRDGSIDLYMVNYENGTYQGYPDHFWFNNGDGTFRNGTLSSGMSEYDHPYQGRGMSFSDMNNDGFMDGYVSNYRIMPNYLYLNQRNGTMVEAASLMGVEGHGNEHPVTKEGPYYGHSLGSSWGDLDNDGDMDLWVTNLAHKDAWRGPICDDSYLFENLGPDEGYSFMDRREDSGIPIKQIPGAILGDGDELMVSSAMADHDNDGDLDLFLPQIYGDVSYAYSYLYSNDGDLKFSDVSTEAGLRVWNTYGSAWCDYNEDGWMDLVTGGGTWDQDLGQTSGYMVHLFRNEGASSNGDRSWLEVDLVGRGSGSSAIGARVIVDVDTDGDNEFDLSIMREVQGGTAAGGQQDTTVLHFGLGNSVEALRMTVKWPMGREVIMDDVEQNTILRLFEPTEDIGVDLTITSFQPTNNGSEVGLTVDGPIEYPITFCEFGLLVHGSQERYEFIIPWNERLEPGSNRIILMAPGISPDIVAEVEVSIIRSYPPLTGEAFASYVHDPMTNLLPYPVVSGPDTVKVGEAFTVDGAGSYDPDGTVVSYLFDMGDGTISSWQISESYTHQYRTEGRYTVRLSVMDDHNSVSVDEAMHAIEVKGAFDTVPVAVIDSIRPDIVSEGETVRFKGHGEPYTDRTITNYEWTSSIDGTIGTDPSIVVDALSLGIHEILFKVRDSEGEWSSPTEGQVEVTPVITEELWVEILPLWSQGPFSGPVLFKGTSGPQSIVENVEVRIDSGPWKRTSSVPEWTFEVDCSKLSSGTHRIDARSFGDGYYSSAYASLEFETDAIVNDTGGIARDQDDAYSKSFFVWGVIFVAVLIFALLTVTVWVMVSNRYRRNYFKWTNSGRPSDEGTAEHPVGFVAEKEDVNAEILEAIIIN
ncbi:MAG: VCBS repeat-containing protein [Candidatus Thermoplasmatota archaeon]|nr:VCBS repeat-containing protein [Candidatus Thermoplasmatota archaeon]